MTDMDGDVQLPDDLFLVSLAQFAQVMMKITQKVYRPKSQSLLSCYNAARSIYEELQILSTKVHRDFGLDLENLSSTDPHGPREAFLVNSKPFRKSRVVLVRVKTD